MEANNPHLFIQPFECLEDEVCIRQGSKVSKEPLNNKKKTKQYKKNICECKVSAFKLMPF